MSERFRPRMRLRHAGQFDEVFRGPERSSDKWVTVLARRNGIGWARLGLAISKKCAPRAVDRNRLKRIIRESFRHHRECLQGLDLVVLGRRRPGENERELFARALQRHWKVVSERSGRC